MNPAKQYATDIVKHRIPAGGYIKLAAHRFLDDLERDDLYFDVEAYNRIVRFFNVVLWDGQMWNGKPMELAPFQHFIIANIYGLKYKSNGRRKTKHVYIQVGRKNTKTTTVAGLALYELTISGENDPQVLVGANNEQQAKICTNQAGKMVEDAELESEGIRLYKYQGKTHTITYNTGTIEAMSKEIKTKDGFMPSLGIVDEYHEATNARLLNVIESGQGNRLEPLSIVITTAGYNKSGPCYQTLRKTAIDILTGVLEDDSQFSLIYEPDPEDKPDDINTWMKANPMMGFIPSIEPYLESRWKKATNEGGETMQEFVTKNLNIWADSSAAPIQDREWVQNTKEAATLFRTELFERLQGKRVWGGLDLGDTGDLTALVLLSEDNEIFPFFWLPERQLSHKTNSTIYKKWLYDRFISLAGVEVSDYRIIAFDIIDIVKKCDLQVIGYDRYRASHGVLRELLDEGINMGEIAQSYSNLTDPTEEMIKLALSGKFENFRNPVMRWMVSNLEIERKGTYKMPSKGKSQNKIDGISALVMALYSRSNSPEPQTLQIIGL